MDKIAWLKTALIALAGGAVSGVVTGAQSGQITKEQITFNALAGAGAVVLAYLAKSPRK